MVGRSGPWAMDRACETAPAPIPKQGHDRVPVSLNAALDEQTAVERFCRGVARVNSVHARREEGPPHRPPAMPVPSSLHNLLMSVTENNDQPAPGDYMEAVLTKTREVEPGPAVDEMAYWIAARLNMHAVPVKIKTLGLMKGIIERGGPLLALAFKSMALPVVEHAVNFSCPPDPTYGDKPMMMVRKLANEMVAQLNSLQEKQLYKAQEKLAKAQEKERKRKARLGPDEEGYDLSPFVSEKWKPPAQLDFGPAPDAAPAGVEEGVPPPQFGLQPAAPQEQLQEEEEEEGFGVFMDVTSPVDSGQVVQQRFEIKKGDTMGTVKRRMSVTMGVSEEEMAVLMGMGNDPDLDNKTVEEAGVITEGKSIKLPAQTGFAQVQFKGKGKFIPLNLELKKGTMQMLNNADNSLMRECNVFGCTVTEPKKTRKGHKNAVRLDVEHADTAGDDKYVISFLSESDLASWKENFLAYSTLDEIGAAMMDQEEEEEDDYDPGGAGGSVPGSPAAAAAAAGAAGGAAAAAAPAPFTGVVFSTEVLKEAVALAEKVATDVDAMLSQGCSMYADAHSKVIADMPDAESTKKDKTKRKAAELKATLQGEGAAMEGAASAETVDAWKGVLFSAQAQLQALSGEGKKEAKEVAPYLQTITLAQQAADPFFAQIATKEAQGLDAISKTVDEAANNSDLTVWVGGTEQKDEFNAALEKANELRAAGKPGDGCRELLEVLKISLRAVIAGGGQRVGARQSSLHPQRWAGELDGVDPWDIDSDDEYEG